MILDAHTHRMQDGRDFSPELAAHYLRVYEGTPSWRTLGDIEAFLGANALLAFGRAG